MFSYSISLSKVTQKKNIFFLGKSCMKNSTIVNYNETLIAKGNVLGNVESTMRYKLYQLRYIPTYI